MSNERLDMAQKSHGKGIYLHSSYDDLEVIKGQGTIGLELIKWEKKLIGFCSHWRWRAYFWYC